jgi:hypothetical protein
VDPKILKRLNLRQIERKSIHNKFQKININISKWKQRLPLDRSRHEQDWCFGNFRLFLKPQGIHLFFDRIIPATWTMIVDCNSNGSSWFSNHSSNWTPYFFFLTCSFILNILCYTHSFSGRHELELSNFDCYPSISYISYFFYSRGNYNMT